MNLYSFNPLCLKLPRIRYKERRIPKNEEITRLISAVNSPEDKLALLLLIDCGIRVSELATIKLNNINFSEASILINGKGGKSRTVYLSEPTLEQLRAYVAKLDDEYLFRVNRADAKLEHRSRYYFEGRLAKICQKAGIERITPHQLRHYFATHTLSNGADVKAVSEILGHADVGITLRIYHHVNTRAIREMHRDYSPLSDLKIAEVVQSAMPAPLFGMPPTSS